MQIKTGDSGDGRRPLAPITAGLFLICGVGAGTLTVNKAFLVLTGVTSDTPLPVSVALLFDLALAVGAAVGSVVAAVLWVLALRPFLSREEAARWLQSGFGAGTSRYWNQVLDLAYETNQ